MDVLVLAVLIATGIYLLNAKEQRKRIALLGRHLAPYQIEKLMETLTDGYLRALGEGTDERRDQIWSLLSTTESQLSEQFNRFAADFAKVGDAEAQVSRLAMALPFAEKILPGYTFDMRRALAIHARGIDHVVQNTGHLSAECRAILGQAARIRKAGWFKSISWMEDVARTIVAPDLHLCDQGFRALMDQVFGWATDGPR